MAVWHSENKAEGNVDQIISQRFFPEHESGKVFVDVGAARPDYLSISAMFRLKGWRILAIEPNPEFCKLYKERGYDVLEYACGDHDDDDVDFSVVDLHGAAYENGQVSYESFSSLTIKDSVKALGKGLELDVKTIRVRLRRLDTILESVVPKINRIDILSVDTEGWELEVLSGLSLAKYRPTVMVIENLFNAKEYRAYMKDNGYILWRRIRPNDVYVDNALINGISRYFLSFYELYVTRCKK